MNVLSLRNCYSLINFNWKQLDKNSSLSRKNLFYTYFSVFSTSHRKLFSTSIENELLRRRVSTTDWTSKERRLLCKKKLYCMWNKTKLKMKFLMKIDKKIIVVSEIIYKEGFEVIYEKKIYCWSIKTMLWSIE